MARAAQTGDNYHRGQRIFWRKTPQPCGSTRTLLYSSSVAILIRPIHALLSHAWAEEPLMRRSMAAAHGMHFTKEG